MPNYCSRLDRSSRIYGAHISSFGFLLQASAAVPPLIPTTVVGVPLNLSHLALNMTLTSKGPEPASEDVPFRMNVKASTMHGYVYSNSPLTGGEQLQALTTNDSASTSKALFNLTRHEGAAGSPAGQQPQQLNLMLPEFQMNFVSRTSGVVGGRPWSGILTFSITGVWEALLLD